MNWNWKSWPWTRKYTIDQFIRDNPLLVGAASRAGVTINERTAFEIAAVRRAVSVLAEGVSQIDLLVFKEEIKDGKKFRTEAFDHPAYRVLRSRVNPWMTSFQWRETMMMHALLTGNAYSIISRVRGEVRELHPVVPSSVKIEQNEHQEPFYVVTLSEGNQLQVKMEEMFHLAGPSWDSVAGLDGVKIAKEVLGLTASLDRTQANFQKNDARPAGVLALEDGELTTEQKKNLVDTWNDTFGEGGRGGIAVLDQGWKFQPMTMTAQDAQMIETRAFQVKEVARMFGVSPLRLYEASETATYASAEQFMQAHVIYDLGPWIKRWEQLIDLRLLPEDDHYALFKSDKLMMGTMRDRAEYYSKALGAGGSPAWMTQDDVRMEVALNPYGTPDSTALNPGAYTAEQPNEAGEDEPPEQE